MPTIHCDKEDCQHIGKRDPICIARVIQYTDGECQSFEAVEKLMIVRNPMCAKSGGRFRSKHGKLIK